MAYNEHMRYIKLKRLLISIVFISMVCTYTFARKDNTKTIYVSIPPLIHFVEQLTKADTYKIVSLVAVGNDAERYTPSPRQLKALGSADMFFGIGLPYEKNIITSLKKKSKTLKIYELGNTLERIYDDDHGDEENDDDTMNDEHLEGNPHIWMSFDNVEKIVYEMYEILSSAYPAEQTTLKENYDAYIARIMTIKKEIQHTFSIYQNRSFLIYHPILSYYAKEFGINQISIQTENTGEASLKKIQTIYDDALKENVHLLLLQKGYDSKNALTLAKKIKKNMAANLLKEKRDGDVFFLTAYVSPLEKNWEEQMLFISDTIVHSFSK